MSLRLFVYYCMVAGAWSGLMGWVVGKIIAPAPGTTYFERVLNTSLVAMCLGMVVAFGLSLLDAIFNLTLNQIGKVFLRVFGAVFVGIFGGLFGGFIGGSIYHLWAAEPVFLVAYTLVGFLIGVSLALFELVASLLTGKAFGGAFGKLIKCVVGGTMGGILGGLFAIVLQMLVSAVFGSSIAVDKLLSPTAIGFVIIGASIGLFVGLAQVLLKEAWIKIEAGYRPGREMILIKEVTSIGRAEGSDIPFFGDSEVEKNHAQIVLDQGRYYLEDLQTPGGTYVNDVRVEGRTPLKAGDLIRVGAKSAFRFNERTKRES